MAFSCIKSTYMFFNDYILYVYNTLCLVSGISFVIFAIFINHKYYKWANFTSWSLNTTPHVLMIIGLVLFLIATIGLCGMVKESPRILTLFTILQSIVVLGELVLPAVILCNKNEIDSYIRTSSTNSIPNYNHDAAVKDTWDKLQKTLTCCGVNNSSDWDVNNITIPPSCSCGMQAKEIEECKSSGIYKHGCAYKLEQKIHEKASLITVFITGYAIIQIIVLVLAYGRVTSLTSFHTPRKHRDHY